MQKSSKFLLIIKIPVSSGKKCLYIMSNRGPRNDPWGTPCFNVPPLQKNFEFYYMIILALSSISCTGPEPICSTQIIHKCDNVGKHSHKTNYILIHAQKVETICSTQIMHKCDNPGKILA